MKVHFYQKAAERTINPKLTKLEMENHALHGMTSELGEIHSIYQKAYQGHDFNEVQLKSELGDLLWFIAEFCTARGWSLEEVCSKNIEKLIKRFPEGFEEKLSLNRAEDDI